MLKLSNLLSHMISHVTGQKFFKKFQVAWEYISSYSARNQTRIPNFHSPINGG